MYYQCLSICMPGEPPKMNFVSQWERELTWSQKSLSAKLTPIEIHWSKKFDRIYRNKDICISRGISTGQKKNSIASIEIKIFAFLEASTYFL